MNISHAIKIFGIKGLNKINEDDIKKKYRRLMQINHPDVGGSEEKAKEVNEAHDILKKALKNIKIYERPDEKDLRRYIIPLSELVEIYLGKELKFDNGEDGENILDRKRLRTANVILVIEISVEHRGETYNFDTFTVPNLRDEYTIDCKIFDTNIYEDSEVKIKAYDKEIETSMNGPRLDIALSFRGMARLTVRVERVERNGQ